MSLDRPDRHAGEKKPARGRFGGQEQNLCRSVGRGRRCCAAVRPMSLGMIGVPDPSQAGQSPAR